MKRLAMIGLACLLALTLGLPGPVMADNNPPTWNSTIYYYNPQPNTGTMGVSFTGQGTVPPDQLNLPVKEHEFGTISVGSTGDFKGAATLSAITPMPLSAASS